MWYVTHNFVTSCSFVTCQLNIQPQCTTRPMRATCQPNVDASSVKTSASCHVATFQNLKPLWNWRDNWCDDVSLPTLMWLQKDWVTPAIWWLDVRWKFEVSSAEDDKCSAKSTEAIARNALVFRTMCFRHACAQLLTSNACLFALPNCCRSRSIAICLSISRYWSQNLLKFVCFSNYLSSLAFNARLTWLPHVLLTCQWDWVLSPTCDWFAL